jgi:hypothetical protein
LRGLGAWLREHARGVRVALLEVVNARILSSCSIALLLTALASGTAAAGEALRIETLEERTWSAAVAALQHDRASEGHVVHVVVRDNDGTRLHCGTYAIGLDVASSEAFQSEGCDQATDTTALRLIHRAALFEHQNGDAFSHPRAPRIVASRTQTGEASGGAKNGAESAVDCTVTVHPFIRDLENGSRIALAPGRYALRAKSDDVKVMPTEDGWTFVGPRGTTTTVEYFVTDAHKNEVVLNDRVSMNCSVTTSGGSASAVPYTPPITTNVPLTTKPYEPPEADGDADSNGHSASGAWRGQAMTVNLGIGSAFMRPSGVRFGNNVGDTDGRGLGLHDAAGPSLLASAAYERPGLYGSFGVAASEASLSHRTLWHFGASSVVAAALHLSDVTLYLGPNVQAGTYQASSDTSSSLAYGSPLQFSLGGAAGARYHVRDEKTGRLAYVLGVELVAPVAGPSPWFLTAQIAFGSGK